MCAWLWDPARHHCLSPLHSSPLQSAVEGERRLHNGPHCFFSITHPQRLCFSGSFTTTDRQLGTSKDVSLTGEREREKKRRKERERRKREKESEGNYEIVRYVYGLRGWFEALFVYTLSLVSLIKKNIGKCSLSLFLFLPLFSSRLNCCVLLICVNREIMCLFMCVGLQLR